MNKTSRTVKALDLDRIEALTVAERAYIAGFFDGEGSIGLYPKGNNFALKLSFAQRKAETLLWMHDIFGGAFVRVERDHPRNNTYYELRHESVDSVLCVLEVIAPYVREKKDQVDLIVTKYEALLPSDREEKNNIVALLKDMKRSA